MIRRITGGWGVVALAVVLSGVLFAPAKATVGPAPARAMVPCKTEPPGPVPVWRQRLDHSVVSPAERARIEREVKPMAAAVEAAERVAASRRVKIPVRIHVIHGTHRKDRNLKRKAARKVFRVLKAGFAGAQNPSMADTGFRFKLRKITITRNDSWYHSRPGTRADKQMHKRLHRGKARTLNIYIKDARIDGVALLGVARFPWQYRGHKKLDGITVNVAGLPGGRARGYNLGDTVVHETGHWLGLFHTFQGGCTYPNDGVLDTPAEQYPSFMREIGRNTCLEPQNDGPDPVQNFMDYSFDSCMNHFTPGQVSRMHAMFARYRTR